MLVIVKNVTTIELRNSVVRELKSIKKYLRQTYNEIIMDLVTQAKAANHLKEDKQYDEFLHTIHQLKMKELWDNEEDDAWENA
ncbi:MAG: hypothetical protein PXY39_07325 [archaeon]|nr:hypothetical protein [archaeon]